MSPGDDRAPIVGINWGSSNFRAYLIARDGTLLDSHAEPSGVVGLDRAGMAALVAAIGCRWPNAAARYASGMIGSNVGWVEVPYAEAPAGRAELARLAVPVTIGDVPIVIVPGIACRHAIDDAPDVLRGEEIEILGSAPAEGEAMIVLPGTHAKWTRVRDGRVLEFVTSMSGEIFDRLTTQGLLASVTEGEGAADDAFFEGVAIARARQMGLGSLLFGARARVVRGEMPKAAASSYVRGLLIGSEIADARAAFPGSGEAVATLVGNGPLSRLYAAALDSIGIASTSIDSQAACLRGFLALHEALDG